MAVTLEMHNIGDPSIEMEVRAMVEHMLADRPGNWRVSIMGSQASDRWEMKVLGSHAFERSYTLGERQENMSRGSLPPLIPR